MGHLNDVLDNPPHPRADAGGTCNCPRLGRLGQGFGGLLVEVGG